MELKDLSAIIPTQPLRERHAELTHRLAGERPIPSSLVERFYCDLEQSEGRTPDKATVEAIKFHRSFYESRLSPRDLEIVDWYSDPSPNHISHHLTNGGKDRALFAVAQRYKAGAFPKDGIESWKQASVEDILSKLRDGQTLPRVILSKRPRGMRPDGRMHIIDGVHRLLALALYQLEKDGSAPIVQDAYMA